MNEEWVSVEERLPAEEDEVLVSLVWTGSHPAFHFPKVELAKRVRGEWRGAHIQCQWLHWRVTHWMPLPQPAADPAPVAAEEA